jgi:hypothetical protein
MGKRGREITTTTTRARNEREKAAKTGRAGEEALGQIRDRLKVRAREKNSKNDEDLRHA